MSIFFQVIGGSGSGAVGCLDFGYCTSSKRFPVRHGSSTSCWLSEALSATDEAFKPQLARTCSRSVCIFARRYSVEQTWVMAKLTEEHWRPGDAEADTGSDTWRLVSETYPSCWKIDWICSSKHAQVEENQWISMDYPWIDLHWMATEPHCSHHFALGDAWSAMGKQGFDSRTALANVACHQPGICWIGWKISKASSGTSNMFNESEGFSRPLDFHLYTCFYWYVHEISIDIHVKVPLGENLQHLELHPDDGVMFHIIWHEPMVFQIMLAYGVVWKKWYTPWHSPYITIYHAGSTSLPKVNEPWWVVVAYWPSLALNKPWWLGSQRSGPRRPSTPVARQKHLHRRRRWWRKPLPQRSALGQASHGEWRFHAGLANEHGDVMALSWGFQLVYDGGYYDLGVATWDIPPKMTFFFKNIINSRIGGCALSTAIRFAKERSQSTLQESARIHLKLDFGTRLFVVFWRSWSITMCCNHLVSCCTSQGVWDRRSRNSTVCYGKSLFIDWYIYM